MNAQYDIWSPTYIDSHPLPKVPRHLLPWLLKDRREAEDGATFYNSETKVHEHDRQGLVYAERELRRIKSDYDAESKKRDLGDRETDRTLILRHQLKGQQERVDFWRGKIYLLDKVIEQTQRSAE